MVEIASFDQSNSLDTTTRNAVSGLIGKRCCRQRVGRGRSLSVGFGGRVPHSNPNTVDSFYGEWEIGTYSSAWRIVDDGHVLCGSMNSVNSIEELDHQLQGVTLDIFDGIIALSPFDIRVLLKSGVSVDFLSASNDDDEMFHIFGPNSLYVEYATTHGWLVGKSNAPWI